MRKTFIIITAAATLVAGGLAYKTLAAGNDTPQVAHGRMFQRIAEMLNLTDDQKAQIKTILRGEKNTLVPLLNQLHDARKNLRAAIRSSDASEAAVRAASANVASVESNLAVERMKLYGQIAPILTDAQRKELADMQQLADDVADNAIARLGSELGN
jgi:Spy/CpxP family protein refolding chaperone